MRNVCSEIKCFNELRMSNKRMEFKKGQVETSCSVTSKKNSSTYLAF